MDQKKRLHSIVRGVGLEGVGTGERATLTSMVLGKDVSHCITYFRLNLALQVDRY